MIEVITIKALKCALNKAIINIGFVRAVLTAMVLCFTAIAYMDLDTHCYYISSFNK